MKPLFGGLVLILIFFFTKIEAANNIQKRKKTGNKAKAAVLDDERHRNDHRRAQISGTSTRQKNPLVFRRWEGTELPYNINASEENAYKLFLSHYEKKGIPNATDITLKLYNQYASGSYKSRGKQSDYMTDRLKKTRKTYFETIIKQRLDQQNQAFQDQSGGSGSNSRGTDHQYQNQYDVRNQSSGYASSSGYHNPYATPPKTPSEDLYSHFDVQPPGHLDFEKISSKNSPSTTALIDNYNIHLRRKHGDNSTGSSSVAQKLKF